MLPNTSVDPKYHSQSNILVAIKPVHLNNIIKKEKTFEFRRFLLPNTVQRMWFIDTDEHLVRYVASIGPGLEPGLVEGEGLGNEDFNAGKKVSTHAYSIQELYQLCSPIPLSVLTARYGIVYPHGFQFLPQRMVVDVPLHQQTRLF